VLIKVRRVSVPPYTVTGSLRRFNPKFTVFSRRFWDPPIKELIKGYYDAQMRNIALGREGYSLKDYALMAGGWHVASFQGGLITASGCRGDLGVYRWREEPAPILARLGWPPPQGYPLKVDDPGEASKIVKEAAKLYGASAVGICRVNKAWVYSHIYDPTTGDEKPLELPEGLDYAVVILVEMNYEAVKTSPSVRAAAEVGLGYSKMAFIASSLAQFIRSLGYEAVPCGNDTALSIPLAIDAGLGQLGRNGLLITPWFGPRVRIAKVFTNLPLKPDQPIDFGVTEFCNKCKLCAKACEAGAISSGDMSYEGPTISNNPGALKWYINPEKCYEFWSKNGADCSTCIAVCPFSDPSNKVVEEEA